MSREWVVGRLPSLVRLLRLRLHHFFQGRWMGTREGLEDLHTPTDQYVLEEVSGERRFPR